MPSVTLTISEKPEVAVTYQTREVTTTITRAEYALVLGLRNEKVACIKFIRDQHKLGLYEAKQVIDTIHSQLTPTNY